MNLVSKEFVVLLLKSDFMQASFVGDTRTVAQPTLNVGLIRSAITPLPSRAEQSRIVAQLEKLQSLTASLKARLTAARTKQAHLAEALIAELTTPTPAEFDAETRFAVRTQRGQGREVQGLALLDKAARQ